MSTTDIAPTLAALLGVKPTERLDGHVLTQVAPRRPMSGDFPPLPCFPCPHASSCCAYGVTLGEEEAAAIGRRTGENRSTAPAGVSGAPG